MLDARNPRLFSCLEGLGVCLMVFYLFFYYLDLGKYLPRLDSEVAAWYKPGDHIGTLPQLTAGSIAPL